MLRLPRKIQETSLILTPEFNHPSKNRKQRREHLKIKMKHYNHVAKNGKIYEKAKDGDKVIKNNAYGGKFL